MSSSSSSFFVIAVWWLCVPKFLARTRKVGNSLVVALPEEIVKVERIKENEFVEISIKNCQKDGFGVFKGMAPFTKEDEQTF